MQNQENKGEIIIYRVGGEPELQIKLENQNIWLTQAQIAVLFDTDRTSIGRHINNLTKTGELEEKSNVQNLHIANSDRPVKFYNLDFILSVGYRVNSKRATQFRIWATNILRSFIVQGYIINEKRLKENEEIKLKELQSAVSLMQQALEARRLEGYEKDLLKIITDYANTWLNLYQFDSGTLVIEGTKKPVIHLEHKEVEKTIERFRTRLMKEKEASDLFGKEVSEKLLSLLGNLRQTYDGKDVYPTLEEKAAHLLYFAVKNHPFVDGNKRIGALLFILFLVQNNFLMNKKGERKINDTALTAITLLVAESKPQHKNTMIKLIVNLINKR